MVPTLQCGFDRTNCSLAIAFYTYVYW
jgi:hypothetical protein